MNKNPAWQNSPPAAGRSGDILPFRHSAIMPAADAASTCIIVLYKPAFHTAAHAQYNKYIHRNRAIRRNIMPYIRGQASV